jgi:nucleoside-diphosphate-sugar epimerase
MSARPEPATLLITGGAGYIGAHTCVALQRAGYRLVVLDNFCNSSPQTLARIQRITGQPLDRRAGRRARPRAARSPVPLAGRSAACCTLPG